MPTARSVQQIYDAFIAEKNSMSTLNALQPNIDSAQTLLSNLNSPSKVADWRLFLWIVAVGHWVLETFWDLQKKEVTDLAAVNQIGSKAWCREQALNFQIGYTLQWINNKYQYTTIDPAAKIVAQAAADEIGGKLIMKVAKSVSNVLQPLSTSELSAFKSYFQQIKIAGVAVQYVNDPADLLKLYLTVYYDALIPLTTLQPAVEAAVNNYITNMSFDGRFVITDLIDSLQTVEGVINPVFNSAAATYAFLPYSPVTVDYMTNAGYMKIDPAFPLSTTITYIANV